MRTSAPLAALLALSLAACGGNNHNDQRVDDSGGPLRAPAVGDGGRVGSSVNGRGVTDSNAARPGAGSAEGVPNNNGVAANGNATTSGAAGSGAQAAASAADRNNGENPTAAQAASNGATGRGPQQSSPNAGRPLGSTP